MVAGCSVLQAPMVRIDIDQKNEKLMFLLEFIFLSSTYFACFHYTQEAKSKSQRAKPVAPRE
jgi:hypothetical protein